MTIPARLRVLCLPTGPDEYAVAVVRALAQVADMHFMLPEAMLERYQDDLAASVTTHPVSWPRHRDPRGMLLAGAMAATVRRIRPDVVHFLGDSVTWLLLALPLLRCPVVVTVHDVAYHPGDTQSRRVPMATIRALRRAAQALIVHGERLRGELAATGVAPAGGIHVVEHPVLDRPLRLAKRLGLRRRSDDDMPVVLFFGRVMAYKGLGLLIEASDLVVRSIPRARFIVAGQGPELARLSGELSERPWFEVRDRYVPDAEMAQLLLDADVLALPYLEASQSGVAAVAIGSGLPVAATDVGELGRTVRQSGIGLVVRPEARAFAAALLTLLGERKVPRAVETCSGALNRAALSPESVARQAMVAYGAAIARAEDAGTVIRAQFRSSWKAKFSSPGLALLGDNKEPPT